VPQPRSLFVNARTSHNKLFTLYHLARQGDMFCRGVEVKACVLIRDDHAVIRRMLHALFEAHDMKCARRKMAPKAFKKL